MQVLPNNSRWLQLLFEDGAILVELENGSLSEEDLRGTKA
jgi:hypothetical protein